MANFNLNKVILGGRLTGDPELKQTQSGVSVCTFGIAVNRRFNSKDSAQQTQADFFNITAWRQSAEFVSKYFRKGSSICVVGTIQNRTWTDQQGVKHYATDIIADEINFVDSEVILQVLPSHPIRRTLTAHLHSRQISHLHRSLKNSRPTTIFPSEWDRRNHQI